MAAKKDDPQAPTEPTVDANGIVTGAWSSPIIPEEPESFLSSNFSVEACCPCFPLAQIETRMGFSSYSCSLSYYLATFTALGFALATLWLSVALWVASSGYRANTSVLARVLWPLGMLVLAALQAVLLVQRIALLRGNVRERFDIPGSTREDRTAAWQETARAVRQMRRHLQIDQAKCCGPVSTLQAYVV